MSDNNKVKTPILGTCDYICYLRCLCLVELYTGMVSAHHGRSAGSLAGAGMSTMAVTPLGSCGFPSTESLWMIAGF